MNLQMDPPGDPLTTRLIEMDREISIKLYLNWQFRYINDLNYKFRNSLSFNSDSDLKRRSGTVANTKNRCIGSIFENKFYFLLM
jgi:hypothetical protein